MCFWRHLRQETRDAARVSVFVLTGHWLFFIQEFQRLRPLTNPTDLHKVIRFQLYENESPETQCAATRMHYMAPEKSILAEFIFFSTSVCWSWSATHFTHNITSSHRTKCKNKGEKSLLLSLFLHCIRDWEHDSDLFSSKLIMLRADRTFPSLPLVSTAFMFVFIGCI